MQVPIYERQATHRAVGPNPEAFGVGIAQAGQQAAQTATGIGQLIQKRAIEMQQEKDAQQVLETETRLRQEMDNLLFNNEDGIFTTRLLNNAENAVFDFKIKAEELLDKYLSSLPGENQKVQFKRIAENHLQSRLSAVAKHEAQQFRAAREQAEKDSDDQSIAEILRDPSLDNVIRVIANRTAQQEVFMTQEGYDDQSKDLRKKQTAGRYAATAILRTLETGNTAAARAMYDEFKEVLATLPPEAALKLEADIKDAELGDFAAKLYNETLSKFKLADGMSDTVRMEKYIYNLTGLSRKEKDALWNYTKAKAGEDDTQRRQWIISNDRNFFNELYKYHDQLKKPLNEALKLAHIYGRDAFDKGEKMRDIMRLYAEDEAAKNNSEIPEIYLELWRGVRFGEITSPEQINAAYDNGLITKAHFYELRKDLDEIRLNGIKEHENDVWKRIELLAPKNAKRKAQFLLAVKEATKGMSPEEAYEIAVNIKKKSFSTTIWDDEAGEWETKTILKYKKEFESQGINLLSIAEFNRAFGPDVVDALGGTVKDVLEFAYEFGGPHNLRIGTPQNNAVRSLMALGQEVTPENVKIVLMQYPSGAVPPTAMIEFSGEPVLDDNVQSIRWADQLDLDLQGIKPVDGPNPQRSFLDIEREKVKQIKINPEDLKGGNK